MIRYCIWGGCLVLASCTAEPPAGQPAADTAITETSNTAPPVAPPGIPRDSLLGAWSADGENFVWVIEPDSILFELDMQRYPYTLAGDTLLIDRGDPAIGLQKTRVLRVSGDTMVIQAPDGGSSEVLLRLR